MSKAAAKMLLDVWNTECRTVANNPQDHEFGEVHDFICNAISHSKSIVPHSMQVELMGIIAIEISPHGTFMGKWYSGQKTLNEMQEMTDWPHRQRASYPEYLQAKEAWVKGIADKLEGL